MELASTFLAAVDVTQRWDAPLAFVIMFMIIWIAAVIFVIRGKWKNRGR